MKQIFNFVLLAGLALAFSTANAKKAATTAAPEKKEAFKLIDVKELSSWIEKDKAGTHIFDANNNETRTKDGVIPGAKILNSVAEYDTTATLPADKKAKLVFYCANTQCMASHEAAKRATDAGYTSVFVMADGIQGWKKAGKTTEPFAHN